MFTSSARKRGTPRKHHVDNSSRLTLTNKKVREEEHDEPILEETNDPDRAPRSQRRSSKERDREPRARRRSSIERDNKRDESDKEAYATARRRSSRETYYKPTGRRRFIRYIDEVSNTEIYEEKIEYKKEVRPEVLEQEQQEREMEMELETPRPYIKHDFDKLDIIIFAASGALGSYTVLEAATVLDSYKWGIAGRNRVHLEMVLRNVAAITGKRVKNTPIFIVDAGDKQSLKSLAHESRLIVNCCTQRDDYTRNLMSACIAAGTHYVDACMEANIIRTARRKFHNDAKKQNVYIVTACGFFSFICDIGINFIDAQFNENGGNVTAVESYTQFTKLDKRMFAPVISPGIFKSILSTFGGMSRIFTDGRGLKMGTNNAVNSNSDTSCSSNNNATNNSSEQAIDNNTNNNNNTNKNPEENNVGLIAVNCAHKVQSLGYTSPISRTDAVSGVSIPMPFIDAPVVKYSQQHFEDYEQKQQIKFKNYLTFPSYLTAMLALIWCAILYLFAQAPGTRELVYRYPSFFSFGMCTKDCIERAALDKLIFTVTFRAVGTEPRDSKPTMFGFQAVATNPNPPCSSNNNPLETIPKRLKTRMCGLNPFYGFGCVALLSSAIIVLSETSSLPETGGVYTPGAAFRNTSIVQEVAKHNSRFKYKIIS